jgi:predicted RND superfamily exporter protein
MKDLLGGLAVATAVIMVAVITAPLLIKFSKWWFAFLGL